MISGGIDSPVAGYLVASQGVELGAVHMDNRPFTDDREVEKAHALIARLREVTGQTIPLFELEHGPNQIQFARNLDRKHQCLFCRRMMWRSAQAFAMEQGYTALVTGESLGQVASQTLSNIATQVEALEIPILRPLLGLDKTEIMIIAREIETLEISERPGLCCTIVPERPAVVSDPVYVAAQEATLDYLEMVAVTKASAKRV